MFHYVRNVVFTMGLMLAAGSFIAASAQDANREVVTAPSDVGAVVDRIQKLSGEFKSEFDKAISHSMVDGTRLEENAKHRADDLHDAANKLGDVFHDKKDKNNPAVREQVDKTIGAGSEINRIMVSHRFTDKLQRNWDMLRDNLNALAQVYGLSPLEGTQGQ